MDQHIQHYFLVQQQKQMHKSYTISPQKRLLPQSRSNKQPTKGNRLSISVQNTSKRLQSLKKGQILYEQSLMTTNQANQYLPNFFTTKANGLADSRKIKKIENELVKEYKQDMSNFLRKKFKQYLFRGAKGVEEGEDLMVSVLSRSSSGGKSISSINNFIALERQNPSKLSKSKVVNDAYVLNAREKIGRMIDMQNKKVECFNEIRCKLKQKIVETNRQRYKTEVRQKKAGQLDSTIEKQEWNRRWISQKSHEKMRYKQRLLGKAKMRQLRLPFF